MSDELDLTIRELRRRGAQDRGNSHHEDNGWEQSEPRSRRYHTGSARGPETPFSATAPESFSEPRTGAFNLWRLFEILLRRWPWIVVGACAAGMIAFLLGLRITSYTAKVTLIRRENPNAFTAGGGENSAPQAYLSRELSAQTLFVLMRAPEVFRRAAEKAEPPVRPDQLAKAVRVVPDRDPDFVTLAVSGKYPKESLAKWANVYADEVVTYTKELQADAAGEISEFLKRKLVAIGSDLREMNSRMVQFSDAAQTLDVDKEVEAFATQNALIESQLETKRMDLETIDMQIRHRENALNSQGQVSNDRVQVAQEELDRLKAKGYSDLWPEVARQKAIIESLKKQGTTGTAAPLESRMPGGSLASAIQLQIVELKSLKDVRQREVEKLAELKTRLQDKAKHLSKVAVEYAQLKAGQRRLEDLRITLQSKQQEAQLLKDNAMGYFRVHAYASPNDVSARQRFFAVTLLAIVGGLLGLLAASGLALIAEALDSRIKTAADLERATGLPVLATLGDLRKMKPEEQINWAFRTLTLLQGKLNSASDETLVCGVISSHHGEGRSTWINLLVSAASQRGMRVLTVATKPSKDVPDDEMPEMRPKETALLPIGPATTLTKNVLAYPTQVTEQFNDPQAQPVVHIPLPGWVWNLERRQQWRTALDHWQDIQNLVLLIELPPASQPESVLLAEHLPQVIWLASSGMAEVEETRSQLETLRHARCNMVGAVLNREPSSFLRKHLGKWVRRLSLVLLAATTSLQAAQPGTAASMPAPTPATNELQSLSVISPTQRPRWLQHLTLGPGDAFDVTVFGHPELTRTNLVVGPDGTVSFLQVQDLPVSGLTIDELRSRLDQQLGKYFVGGARTIVVPSIYASKKYYLLGKVVTEGVFTLDRPLTIIEAVARAKGLQTGTFERNTAEVADLPHSFLVRDGKRMPIDLERLFHEGDLSQNIALEPNDYLYFAPAAVHEIYVLGEVFSPGPVAIGSEATVTGALSARGGFTERAYRKRVLVVRGSLQRPEAYAIDAPAILAGRIPDFRLQPRDIVYVNARPWIRVEELLDIAAQAFIEASVTEWAGAYVPAVFTSPIIPHP